MLGRSRRRSRGRLVGLGVGAFGREGVLIAKHEVDRDPLVGEELDEDLGVGGVVLEVVVVLGGSLADSGKTSPGDQGEVVVLRVVSHVDKQPAEGRVHRVGGLVLLLLCLCFFWSGKQIKINIKRKREEREEGKQTAT